MKALTSIITVLAVGTMFATAAEEKKAGAKPEGSKVVEPVKTGTDATKPVTDPAKPAVEGEKKKADPEAAFKKLDANADGSISLDEMKAGPMGKRDPAKAEETFKKKDKDADGKLTLEEFKGGGKKK